MNARILELIKQPAILLPEDAALLQTEIQKYPYCQSLRAINLLCTHKFSPENYAAELSATAAYTTDKKILYQFINKKTIVKKVAVLPKLKTSVKTFDAPELLKPETVEMPEPVFVDGVLNRILFKGEEDFLQRESNSIDVESSLENGTLITQPAVSNKIVDVEQAATESTEENRIEEKATVEIPSNGDRDEARQHATAAVEDEVLGQTTIEPEKEVVESENTFEEADDAESFSDEEIVNEEQIPTEPTEIHSSEISFHGVQEFLPDVQISSNISEKPVLAKIQTKSLSKQEEEMQRLIAEVEAKVKALKKEKTKEELTTDHSINFAETQSFETQHLPEKQVEAEQNLDEKPIKTTHSTAQTDWKPMQVESHQPDAFINKDKEAAVVSEVLKKEETIEDIPETKKIVDVEIPEKTIETIAVKSDDSASEQSNIPAFINTWEAWLKLDRTEEKTIAVENTEPTDFVAPIDTDVAAKPQETKEEKKIAAIDKFIEKEPKISKYKEDAVFASRDKSSDIAHLMTETLAQLYVEQKLYTLAISAFETLAEKHPERKKHFLGKAKAVKDLRKNPS